MRRAQSASASPTEADIVAASLAATGLKAVPMRSQPRGGHADAVDRERAFPREAIAAARSQRLLGIMVPRDLGGEGAGISDAVDVCYTLGRACASTAMIYAMHQTKVALVVRHGRASAWHQRLLQRLCASSCCWRLDDGGAERGRCQEKRRRHRAGRRGIASNGRRCHLLWRAGRRHCHDPRAPPMLPLRPGLVVFLKEGYSLERLVGWDTLGMRGTCSSGFKLRATGERDQILPEPYETIHPQTMMPVAHLTWSGAWTGVAAGAVERARLFVRERRAVRTDSFRGCGASDAGERLAADAAGIGRIGPAAVRTIGRTYARIGRFPDRDEPAQGQCVGAGDRDRDELAAGLRADRLPQRREFSIVAICATCSRRRS